MRIVKRLRASSFLAWHLLQSLLERSLRIRRRGLKEFQDGYRPDKIVAYTAEEKKLLPLFSRCIQCGLCDSLCPVVVPSALAPSSLPYLSRSIPNFAGLSLNLDRCSDCRHCESICPTGVPLTQLLEFIRSKTLAGGEAP